MAANTHVKNMIVPNLILTNMFVTIGFMKVSNEPRSRRDRPAKPALTRAGIVAAAVAVLRSEGLDRVTLRRLAQELDTGAASLYVYFRNTAALHAAVLDELLGTVPLRPAREVRLWSERASQALWSYFGTLIEHPSLARSALVSRPSGPNYLALLEYLVGSLRDGGASGEQAAWGVDVLLLNATALAVEHGERSRAAGAAEEEQALAAAISQAPASRYPMIASISAELLSGSPRERFDWLVSVLLTGITTTPRRPAGTPTEGES
jgi:AcrR family transcriptional regulator